MSNLRHLSDVATVVAGFAFSETHQGRTNLPTPFIKVSDFALGKDSWLSTAANSVDGQILTALRAKIYPAGTIVFPKVGGALLTNKRARLAVDATFDNNVMGLIPTQIDGDYLFYFMRSFDMAKIANTQSLPSVRASDVSKIEIPVPTPETQRQIAARLRSQLTEVETARQAAQVQLSDTRLLRASMLKAFFAEMDATPRKKLGEFAHTTSGSTPARGEKRYWSPAEIAWVKTGEVAFKPITDTEEAISKLALAECSLSLLPPKTILVAMYGQGKTRGQSAILEIPATTNQACFAILPNDTWEPDFLYLWLKSSYQDLRDLSEDRGGNQANLNGALLNALYVPAPSKTDQQHMVARIQAAMTEIDAMEQSSKAAQEDIKRLPSKILAQAFDLQGN
ncbi:MAG: restriction endonuclease subunit S [Rhodoferax sp.]|nr:restriction endonuclease subunit S [Rhodoferax sp.]MCF8209128.1 restriction endonuclease subunit S [Rhodoferax sp.]